MGKSQPDANIGEGFQKQPEVHVHNKSPGLAEFSTSWQNWKS